MVNIISSIINYAITECLIDCVVSKNFRLYHIVNDLSDNLKSIYICITEHPSTNDGNNDNMIKKFKNYCEKNQLLGVMFTVITYCHKSGFPKNFIFNVELYEDLEYYHKISIKIFETLLKKIKDLKYDYKIVLACGQHIFTQLCNPEETKLSKKTKEICNSYLEHFLDICMNNKSNFYVYDEYTQQNIKISKYKNNVYPKCFSWRRGSGYNFDNIRLANMNTMD